MKILILDDNGKEISTFVSIDTLYKLYLTKVLNETNSIKAVAYYLDVKCETIYNKRHLSKKVE